MIINKRAIILFFLCSLSAIVFAQSSPKTKEQAEAEAKEKAEAIAKKREAMLKELREQQAKAEHNQAKMSEANAASVNAKAEAFYLTAMEQINEKHISWIKENAKKIYEENLDVLAFKIMTNYYGKKAGLSKMDIDGLQVLLLREAYMLNKNEYNNYQTQSQIGKEKVLKLLKAQQMLSDSSSQVNKDQLDSINLLINNSTVPEIENSNKAETQQGAHKVKTSEIAARKKEIPSVSLSELALTKMKLSENITSIGGMQDEQTLRMQQITQRQQKITQMLSTMVNQVTSSQGYIIKNLK